LSSSIEEGDFKAGFYYDLKFLIGITYIIFFIFNVLSGLILSTKFGIIILIFLSIETFLDIQEFVEVKVPRYGWKCSRDTYKLACVFLVMGVLLVPIADFLIYSEIITKAPAYLSVIFFFLIIVLIAIPILGIFFTLTCYLNFYHSLGISLWKRDKEIIEAYSKNSFFYRKFHRRKRQI